MEKEEKSKYPVMITAAMDGVELEYLKKKLKNISKKEGTIATFYEATFEDYPVVLCHTQVGSIFSASALTEAIALYKPIAIITQGIAGGHAEKVKVGDLVVSTDIINICSYQTTERKEKEGSNPFSWKLQLFREGIDGEDIALQADKNLLDCAKKVQAKQTDENIFFGRIGSGDVWNREVDYIEYLQNKYHTLCEEMEGFAIFQIAKAYNIPILDIRAISNHEVKKEPYQKDVASKAQKFTLAIISEWLNTRNEKSEK